VRGGEPALTIAIARSSNMGVSFPLYRCLSSSSAGDNLTFSSVLSVLSCMLAMRWGLTYHKGWAILTMTGLEEG
jgi:hypothetical protein